MARILIVDDDADTCDVMRRLFAKWGWESDCLTDSREALTAVRDQRPDVVLLDVMMPDLDGFAVLAEIRGDPLLTRTPVLFFSAMKDQKTLGRALAEGADDYILKGTPPTQIRDRVGLYVDDGPNGGGPGVPPDSAAEGPWAS